MWQALTLSKSYPISIRAVALAGKKRAASAGGWDIMMTYLETGGAAQNASMISLQMIFSKAVFNVKERLDRITKSWPFLVGLTNIQQMKPTGKIEFYEYQKQRCAGLSPYYQARFDFMLSLPELRALGLST